MNVTTLGIDLAKNIFQLHGANSQGKALLKKKISRDKLVKFMANFPTCRVVMEACSSSNYWARKFKSYGHEVRLISPQFVKPFVKGSKNDRNDSEAIVEAASRANMRYVSPKTIEQQDMQSLLRLRASCIEMRTKISNQLRGLLLEYGIVITQGTRYLRKKIVELLDQEVEEITINFKELLSMQYDLWISIDEKVVAYDKKISSLAKEDAACQRIQQVEGIGEVTAIALVSTMGNPNDFKNGRHFAAYLGLVPRQNSSGGRNQLLGITKRGDSYIRQLLIHGARSVVMYAAKKKPNKRTAWVNQLKSRAGTNRTCVAVANKNARIAWALLKREENYRKAA